MADVSPRNSVKERERKVDAPVSAMLKIFHPNGYQKYKYFFFNFQYAGLRKGLLTLYIIIIVMFVVATVVIAVLAPIGETVRSLQSKIMD